jgi:gliding motility-associated-like protein
MKQYSCSEIISQPKRFSFMNKLCKLRLHYCFLFVMLSLISFSAMSQVASDYRTEKWRFSDPKQFGFTVLDVQFYDNNLGIAVGQSGGIAVTTNGGTKWSYGPFTFISPAGLITSGNFNDVHIATANVAYAVGSNGMMAKSINAGKNWSFVTTPLYSTAKSINTCWFLNKDTGYIAGQFNTPDSLPKIYFTRNGGTTWDSLAAPASNGTTKVGYVQNTNYPPIDYPINAKSKEIQRIIFTSPTVGYIVGGGSTLFPNLGIPSNTTTTNCVGTGTALTTGSHNASLLWKFENGVLTDYSLSKERLGYTGYPALPPFNCTSKFGTVTSTTQQYRAINIINDSLIVMMSFNNSIVVRVRTGKNDSTLNVNKPGVYEKGKYEVLNTGNSGAPVGYPAIPPVQVLNASNPYQLRKASNGKLYAATNFGLFWTSVDTGRNWKQEYSLPQGRNYSSFATWAFDILPNGRFITMGQGGVVADSTPGGTFNSSYVFVGATGNKVDFVDCNNGIITGGSQIAVTTNGGNSWVNKDRADFNASGYNISGFSYTKLNKAYFAVSSGVIYSSGDQATTLDPIYSDFNYQMNDVVGFGNDTVYAVGYSAFSVPTASRKSTFFRSVNGGVTWQTVDIAVTTTTPAFTAPTINKMAFSSRTIGYVTGTRNGVYKTTDGGLTWTNISPFPSLNYGPTGYPNTTISYTSIQALDDNTVILVGNMFTNAAVKRVYKTTDGGATWLDITSNIPAFGQGNLVSMVFSDANNGYVAGGNSLYVTSNGGSSWTMEVAPHGNIQNAMGFAPRTVPAAIPFANRKLFIGTLSFGSGIPSIMEFGDTLNVNVNSTEAIVNANCTNPAGGSVTVTTQGGIAPYAYSINGGATYQTSNVFSGLTQGPKTVTIKDAFCGTIIKTVNVGFTDDLTLTTTPAIDTTVCAGAPVPLVATATAGSTYLWTPTAGLSSSTVGNPTAVINSATNYSVTASLNGCTRNKIIPIKIKPNPIISAGPSKTIIIGDFINLEGSGAAGSITWTPGAYISSGANTYTPLVNPPTTSVFTLSVTDANSCTSTANTTVTVLPYCVKPMGAFTPNNDGINDKWLATISGGTCATKVSVVVYNRYGHTVYSNENYQNDWDGTYKGEKLPDGTYYYYATYQLINGKYIRLSGDVTILR